jgi:hypothetical protein
MPLERCQEFPESVGKLAISIGTPDPLRDKRVLSVLPVGTARVEPGLIQIRFMTQSVFPVVSARAQEDFSSDQGRDDLRNVLSGKSVDKASFEGFSALTNSFSDSPPRGVESESGDSLEALQSDLFQVGGLQGPPGFFPEGLLQVPRGLIPIRSPSGLRWF